MDFNVVAFNIVSICCPVQKQMWSIDVAIRLFLRARWDPLKSGVEHGPHVRVSNYKLSCIIKAVLSS